MCYFSVYITLFVDDDSDKSVSILLDGEESTMEFVDKSDRKVNHIIHVYVIIGN